MRLLHLLSPRFLAARHAVRAARLRTGGLALLVASFWLGCFLFFTYALHYFQTITALGPVLTQRLLVLLFVSFFAVLLLSNVVTTLTTFYGAAEVNLLLAAPLSGRELHRVRFIETLFASSWMVLLFGIPAFAAYGVVYRAGLSYYAGTVAALLPFLVIPAVVGVLFTTVIVLAFPARRVGEVFLVGGALLSAGVYVWFRMLRPEQLAQPSGLAGFAAFLADVGAPSPYWPTTWAAEVLIPLLGARTGEPLFHLGLLWSTAATLYLLAGAALERVYLRAWSRAQEGRTGTGRERPLARWMGAIAAPLPRIPGLLLTKDALVFVRDPRQWSQLVLLLALAVVYVYNFSVLPLDDGSPLAAAMRQLAAFCNLALAAFVTASVAARFVFPAISLEGRAWWVLRTAPVPLRTVWWSKFTISFVPLVTLAELLVGVTNRYLGVGPGLTLVFMATLLLLVAAMTSLGLAFGAAYPRFDTRNPAQMATSFGALVYMMTCLVLIAVVVGIEAWPISRLFLGRMSRLPLARWEMAVISLAFTAVGALTVTAWAVARRAGLRGLAALPL